MCEEPSDLPGFLDLPHNWSANHKALTIIDTYDGPTPGEPKLEFTGGLSTVNGVVVASPTLEYPDRYTITYGPFVVGVPTTDDNKVIYKLSVMVDSNKIDLYYGEWQLKVLEV